ncbi:phospholipid/cholesterol/gamma-HCH transport system permease protein [Sulfitobacter marinus]|uniref:Phospholipid/cholesterol/gamma-HCH transport system permease protein n=1 Tax=Sulfitobacter marinus TaxID=394264 RepID=A0A1I6QRV5_9RHOB|nr:MlaE family lipid ABC transporter permease subunit [Sulfitobacter marinus]SFS55140.1 phospholipid/cholesterol/gamma-HCH transport system permease protein [Sulfitobacter marinus]
MTEPAAMPAKTIQSSTFDGTLTLSGRLLIDTLLQLEGRGGHAAAEPFHSIDITDLSQMDTAGAWFLIDQKMRAARHNIALEIRGASQAQAQLIATVEKNMPPKDAAAAKPLSIADRFEVYGRKVVRALRMTVELTSFLGQVIATLGGIIRHPSRLRLTSVVHHCQEIGVSAVPIVALMAFLIGVVLAFQGSAQLRQFGAEVFVVDLIAISILRELGILLTAIIVAGRSGSAFTASIGSMKMREEIDAMRTLGLDPVTILVVPRVLALMLMLPALGFIADISGLVGGALMSWIDMGVSPAVFQTRLVNNTDVWHFSVGMIKAPFFALIIGIIGCYEGMKVGGDAESLGRLTSASVVLSIFMVIVMDALFSVFFAVVGV